MERKSHHPRCWRTRVALVAVGLTAGCTIYEPLDQGSRVPWAQAQLTRGEAASVPPGATQLAALGVTEERYRVRRGDRLGDVARSFGVSVADLAQANGLEAPYLIRTGQELQIPTRGPGTASGPTVLAKQGGDRPQVAAVRVTSGQPVRTSPGKVVAEPVQVAALEVGQIEPAAGTPPAPAPQAEKPVRGSPDVAFSADSYTVGSGDTLSGIARRLDVGMSELATANGLGKPYRVYAGQKLRVPNGNAAATTTVKLGEDQGSVRLATGKPPPLDGADFLWPVNGKVIGAFGPIDQWRRRDGIDIAARRGAPVLAAQDGIVAYAGDGIPGYGEMILIRHDQGYITTYAHNAVLLVAVGDVVRRGQLIARVGDTGETGQPMLHFELRKGRQAIDPETRLVKGTTTVASTTEETG
jgi:murein DD-endopeptidase MepM/ murein hydrolase activator NlpD